MIPLPQAMTLLRARHAPDADAMVTAMTAVRGERWGEAQRCDVGSRLSQRGAPVELAFVWPGGKPRLTLDPLPEGAAAERRRRAAEHFFRSTPAPPTAWRGACRRGGDGELSWGAWLGARRRAGGVGYKLYLEPPARGASGASRAEWLAALTGPAHLPVDGGPELVMAGLDLATNGVELYYKLRRLRPGRLSALIRSFGGDDRADEVLVAIGALDGRPCRGEMPVSDLGFSVGLLPDTDRRIFTFFTGAQALLGPDCRIRCRLLAFARDRGWDLSLYEELTRLLPERPEFPPWHGLIGFTAAGDAPVRLALGLAFPGAQGSCPN